MSKKNSVENDSVMETATQEVHSNRARKKEDSIIRTWEEPVLPSLCKIIFVCMILIMAAMLLVDCVNFLRYNTEATAGALIGNVSTTGFFGFLIFSVFLIPLSALGRHQNTRRVMSRKKKDGSGTADSEAKARTKRAIDRLNHPYKIYQYISGGLCLAFGILYLLSQLLITIS